MRKRLVELKARIDDIDETRRKVLGLGGRHLATVRQVDTYFRNVAGRLKLRVSDGRAKLIYYLRPDVPGIKGSDVRIAELASWRELERALSETLGVYSRVRKTRELYSLMGVEVHLDTVDGLGSFLEFELEVAEGEEEDGRRLLEELALKLGIKKEQFIAVSYSDMVAELG